MPISWLISLTLLLAPTYAVRFGILGLPTNLLMVWVFLVWAIFALYVLSKNKIRQFVTAVTNCPKIVLTFIGLFFTAGTVSLFVGGADQAKLGQFVVLFLQPIGTFFVAKYIFEQNPKAKDLLLTACYLLLAFLGLYAVFQYFTLIGLPEAYWGNSVEPKRAVAFFTHPNFYALFSAPLLAFLIPDMIVRAKSTGLKTKWPAVAWVLGTVGLGLSLSRAGWLGLAIAAIMYLFVAADKQLKKIAIGLTIAGVLIVAVTPNLRYRFLLPFYGEKSAVSRLSLWDTGWKGIQENPVLGLGINGFGNNWNKLNTDPGLDTHNYPHNVFLNFWVETGLLGLIGIMGLMAIAIFRGLKNKQNTILLGTSLFLIALLTQGLIDNPYFKNDLALVFWILLALEI